MSHNLKFDLGPNGNSELSEKLQIVLFNLGYQWLKDKKPRHLNERFLYTQSSGYLAWGNQEPTFNRRTNFKQIDPQVFLAAQS